MLCFHVLKSPAMTLLTIASLGFGSMFQGCAGGGRGTSGAGVEGAQGSEAGGSTAINPKEETEYAKALLKCHRTGGTRVVKIEGALRCY